MFGPSSRPPTHTFGPSHSRRLSQSPRHHSHRNHCASAGASRLHLRLPPGLLRRRGLCRRRRLRRLDGEAQVGPAQHPSIGISSQYPNEVSLSWRRRSAGETRSVSQCISHFPSRIGSVFNCPIPLMESCSIDFGNPPWHAHTPSQARAHAHTHTHPHGCTHPPTHPPRPFHTESTRPPLPAPRATKRFPSRRIVGVFSPPLSRHLQRRHRPFRRCARRRRRRLLRLRLLHRRCGRISVHCRLPSPVAHITTTALAASDGILNHL